MSIEKRTYKTTSLQEAIKKYLEVTQLNKKAKISLLLHKWENVVGKTIAKRTLKVSYHNNTLYIKLKTGIDAFELNYLKKAITIKVNKFVDDPELIKSIKIL